MDKYVYTGMNRAQVSNRVSYRHDIRDVPSWAEHHVNEYRLDQRIALVWFIFHENYSLREACSLIDSGWCDRNGIDWARLDRFALDDSKTFINGRRFL